MTSPSPRDRALDGLEQEIGAIMTRVRRAIGERARLVHPELQAGGYLILRHLQDRGPRRATDLSAALGLDKAAVSRQVQQLLDLGLVDKEPDPDDGRATRLAVTTAAALTLADVGRERRGVLDARLVAWSDDDLTSLVDLLRRYNATLD